MLQSSARPRRRDAIGLLTVAALLLAAAFLGDLHAAEPVGEWKRDVIVIPFEVLADIGSSKIIYETLAIPQDGLKHPTKFGIEITLTEVRVDGSTVDLGTQFARLDEVDVVDPDAGDGFAIIGIAWDTAELSAQSLVEACATPFARRGHRWQAVGPETCEVLDPLR